VILLDLRARPLKSSYLALLLHNWHYLFFFYEWKSKTTHITFNHICATEKISPWNIGLWFYREFTKHHFLPTADFFFSYQRSVWGLGIILLFLLPPSFLFFYTWYLRTEYVENSMLLLISNLTAGRVISNAYRTGTSKKTAF
jgi:hypothetical protein